MRVVLDTNIFLSALISPHGFPDKIYQAWRLGFFEVVTSKIQLDEIRRASRYPKFKAILQPAKVGAMVNNLHRAIVLKRLTLDMDADDPNDRFLLAMAVAAHADYLITGDLRAGLLQRGAINRTRIVKAAQFCEEVLKMQDKQDALVISMRWLGRGGQQGNVLDKPICTDPIQTLRLCEDKTQTLRTAGLLKAA